MSPNEKPVPIRVFITSDNGVSVRPHMYKEVEDPRTGEVSEGGCGMHWRGERGCEAS